MYLAENEKERVMDVDRPDTENQGTSDWAPTERISWFPVPEEEQPVEKVVVGPIGSPKPLQNASKPVQNATKSGFKALERGSENNAREFFNTLMRGRGIEGRVDELLDLGLQHSRLPGP